MTSPGAAPSSATSSWTEGRRKKKHLGVLFFDYFHAAHRPRPSRLLRANRCLQHGNVVYFLTMAGYARNMACVIAVDMRKKMNQSVAEFDLCAQKTGHVWWVATSFGRSSISAHLPSGKEFHLKRPGMPLHGSHKKIPAMVHTVDVHGCREYKRQDSVKMPAKLRTIDLYRGPEYKHQDAVEAGAKDAEEAGAKDAEAGSSMEAEDRDDMN